MKSQNYKLRCNRMSLFSELDTQHSLLHDMLRALILPKTWRHTSHLLTYLLTYIHILPRESYSNLSNAKTRSYLLSLSSRQLLASTTNPADELQQTRWDWSDSYNDNSNNNNYYYYGTTSTTTTAAAATRVACYRVIVDSVTPAVDHIGVDFGIKSSWF